MEIIMKRITAIITACLMLMMCFINVPNTKVDAESTEKSIEIKFLNTLGIIDSDTDLADDIVTREMFAVYVAKALKTENNSEVRYFSDVESSGFSASAINALADRKIISVPDDHMFRPGDYISKDEAIKMLICVLGYYPYAEANGGYPYGYIKAANRIGLKTQCSDPNVIKVSEAAVMLADTIKAPILDTKSITKDGADYTDKHDDNILSIYWNIYKATGTLEYLPGASILSTGGEEDNRAGIGGENYTLTDGLDVSEFLAAYVDGYYQKSGNNSEKNLVFVQKSDAGKDDIYVDTNLFSRYKDSTIYRYTDINSSRTIGTYVKDPIIIYNGSVLGSNVAQTFAHLNKGNIVIKDGNGDGTYDTIVITDYNSLVIGYVNKQDEEIHGVTSGDKKFLLKDYDRAMVYDVNGEPATLENVAVDDVVSYRESADGRFVQIIILGDKISGTLKSVQQGDNGLLKIQVDDEWAEVDKYYESNLKTLCSVGEKYIFIKDTFGQVVYAKKDDSSTLVFGYLKNAVRDTTGFDDDIQLQILTADNKLNVYYVAESVKVDGEIYKGEKRDSLWNYLKAADGTVEQQIIRYSLKDDKITEIDTKKVGIKENADNSLYDIFNDNPKESRWYNAGNIARMAVTTPSMPVFYIPRNPRIASDEDYIASNRTFAMTSDENYICDAYKAKKKNGYADAVVVYYNSENSLYEKDNYSKQVFVIDEISEAYEDGEICKKVKGFEMGRSVEKTADNDIDLSELSRGDAVAFSSDMKDRIIPTRGMEKGYELIYDCSAKKPVTTQDHWNMTSTGFMLYNTVSVADYMYYRSNFQASFGYALNRNENVIEFSASGFDKPTEGANIASTPVLVYDEEADTLKTGSIADIAPYSSVGEKCSRLLYCTRAGAGILTVVYNYK